MIEQNTSMDSVVAPKPSQIRRSGKINYTRASRLGRPGSQPTAVRRLTAAQQQYAEAVRRKNPPPPEPVKVDPPKEEVVDDDAIENMLNQTFDEEDMEEKKVDTPDPVSEEKKVDAPDPEPEAILDDKMFGYENNPASDAPINPQPDPPPAVENEATPAVENGQSDQAHDGPEESTAEPSAVPSTTSKKDQARPRRVYHRPHTNQTVVAGDDDSMASGFSQPSWGGRRAKMEEEEDDDEEELSQTSLGNSKRRARMSRRKRRDDRKPSRSSANDAGAKFGHAVSQAFDNLLGYGGGPSMNDDESFSTRGSENIMSDWQEAILSTLGCTVPQHGMTMRTNTFDDETTVESNKTGGQSRNSSVRHRRTKSDLSGSVFSAVEGSVFGSILSFDTTEELADFSKDKKAKKASSKGNYKIPEDYDANPPAIPQPKEEKPMYSEDLYSNAQQPDFDPVDLLSEGDNMIESVGKDLLNVAKSAVDDVITLLLAPTKSEESDKLAPAVSEAESGSLLHTVSEAESGSLLHTLSNVSEPLKVITENDGEGSPARKQTKESNGENAFTVFESFENNVFEAKESANEAEIPKSDSGAIGDPGDIIIKETESDASLFDGIENQESNMSKPEKLLPEVLETSQEQDESTPNADEGAEDLLVKPSEDATSTKEETESPSPSSTATPPQISDTTNAAASSTAKASADSIAVDREETTEPAVEPASEPVVSADVAPVSPPPVNKLESTVVAKSQGAKKAEKTSFEAATTTPETKKKKKGVFKKLFSRSKKEKKGSKKASTPLASMTENQSPESTLSKSKPDETIVPSSPEEETIPSPAAEVEEVVASPEATTDGAPEDVDAHETGAPEDVETEEADHPDNDTTNVGDGVRESSELPPCPTTPVREPEGVANTPKTSNLVSEDRKLTKPVSGTNLADLPGIDEAKSFREDPPASSPRPRVAVDPPTTSTNSDGFGLSFEGGHVAGFETLQNIEAVKSTVSSNSFDDPKEVSFDAFNLDFETNTWESFGDNSEDVGHAAFKQNLVEDANKTSPQKVSAFPIY